MSPKRLKITNGPLKHARFIEGKDVVSQMCLFAPKGMVIGLVGPTQVGKSFILESVVEGMMADAQHAPKGSIPFVHLQIESVSEGRVRGKWLDLQMLKQLKHPVYMHIGELDEREHYAPSRGRDEGSLRNALKAALCARQTERVVLDEAHLLTRTTKGDLRGNVLESLKSMAAIDRTLILCGGYELAYKGLFDNSHFIGRTIIYDFSAYESNPSDLQEWARILKSFSAYLSLSPKTLLIDRVDATLRATNGSIGLLEKWLWACKTYAAVKKTAIDIAILRMWAPSIKEQQTIANDIRLGKEALARLPTFAVKLTSGEAASETHLVSDVATTNWTKPKKVRRPFERSPQRTEIAGLEIYVDD